jgi:hypothetical protein
MVDRYRSEPIVIIIVVAGLRVHMIERGPLWEIATE